MSRADVTPIIIRHYEPDPERCVRALARLLGVSLNPPAVPAPTPLAPTVSVVALPAGVHSLEQRRRRTTTGKRARKRAAP